MVQIKQFKLLPLFLGVLIASSLALAVTTKDAQTSWTGINIQSAKISKGKVYFKVSAGRVNKGRRYELFAYLKSPSGDLRLKTQKTECARGICSSPEFAYLPSNIKAGETIIIQGQVVVRNIWPFQDSWSKKKLFSLKVPN